jgi:hypothetical protein
VRTYQSQAAGGEAGALEELLLRVDRPFTIGSDPGCDVVVTGALPLHAQIVRDEHDEFVIEDRSGGATTLDGRAAEGLSMHTGDRLRVGDWVAVFQREERSDHGRPFGGRQGGEGDLQLPQPSRQADPGAPRPAGPTAEQEADERPGEQAER